MTNQQIYAKIDVLEERLRNVRGTECEIFSRVCGFYRPVKDWNNGKQEEFKERKMFDVEKM